jgi:hypothetical protein
MRFGIRSFGQSFIIQDLLGENRLLHATPAYFPFLYFPFLVLFFAIRCRHTFRILHRGNGKIVDNLQRLNQQQKLNMKAGNMTWFSLLVSPDSSLPLCS